MSGKAALLLRRTALRLKDLEYRVTAFFVLGALRLARRFDPDRALAFADRAARRIGPWVRSRHRLAIDNISRAMPEKSEAEVAAIVSDMWGSMGRLVVEYVFLDKLFEHDFDGEEGGRIEVIGKDRFIAVRDSDRPAILFTAHTGNFEMLAVAASAFGMKMSALFRPPNNPYVARELLSLRHMSMGDMVASRAGAAFSLARILDRGGRIGVLVDQKFRRGIRNSFFGLPCESSPLVPRLTKQYEPDLYPCRSIRLPGNRYRLELQEKVELPRGADGDVDVEATAQLLNDVVEGWIREHPGQWMWFHKRWDIRPDREGDNGASGRGQRP